MGVFCLMAVVFHASPVHDLTSTQLQKQSLTWSLVNELSSLSHQLCSGTTAVAMRMARTPFQEFLLDSNRSSHVFQAPAAKKYRHSQAAFQHAQAPKKFFGQAKFDSKARRSVNFCCTNFLIMQQARYARDGRPCCRARKPPGP